MICHHETSIMVRCVSMFYYRFFLPTGWLHLLATCSFRDRRQVAWPVPLPLADWASWGPPAPSPAQGRRGTLGSEIPRLCLQLQVHEDLGHRLRLRMLSGEHAGDATPPELLSMLLNSSMKCRPLYLNGEPVAEPSTSDLCMKGTESFVRSESEEMAKSAVAPLPKAPRRCPRLQ